MFIHPISDERFITSSDDIKNGSSYSGGKHPWPKTTLDTPLQVKLGEPFDVTLTWSMVEFDKETGEIDNISESDEGIEGISMIFYTQNGTKLISAPGFEISAERINHYNITTFEYHKVIPYDNTKVHSETITLQIEQPMREPYNNIKIITDSHHQDRYLTYSGDIVKFDGKPTYPKFGDKLDTVTYPSVTIREEDENVKPNPEFIDSLAVFIKNNIITQNMTQYLLDENIHSSIIDALFQKYPELMN